MFLLSFDRLGMNPDKMVPNVQSNWFNRSVFCTQSVILFLMSDCTMADECQVCFSSPITYEIVKYNSCRNDYYKSLSRGGSCNQIELIPQSVPTMVRCFHIWPPRSSAPFVIFITTFNPMFHQWTCLDRWVHALYLKSLKWTQLGNK